MACLEGRSVVRRGQKIDRRAAWFETDIDKASWSNSYQGAVADVAQVVRPVVTVPEVARDKEFQSSAVGEPGLRIEVDQIDRAIIRRDRQVAVGRRMAKGR